MYVAHFHFNNSLLNLFLTLLKTIKSDFILSQMNKVLRILTNIKRLVALEGLSISLLWCYSSFYIQH